MSIKDILQFIILYYSLTLKDILQVEKISNNKEIRHTNVLLSTIMTQRCLTSV